MLNTEMLTNELVILYSCDCILISDILLSEKTKLFSVGTQNYDLRLM